MLSCGTVKELSFHVESGLPWVEERDLWTFKEPWLKLVVGEEGTESSEAVSALNFKNLGVSENGDIFESFCRLRAGISSYSDSIDPVPFVFASEYGLGTSGNGLPFMPDIWNSVSSFLL